MPLLSTPAFLNVPQLDDFELQYDTNNLAPSTPAQFQFIYDFQAQVLALIRSLPAGTGVFSSTCLVHCLSGQSSFQEISVPAFPPPGQPSYTLSSVLTNWYFATGGETQAISTCQGWNCTAACGVTNNGVPCRIGSGFGPTLCGPIELATVETPPLAPSTSPTGIFIPGEASDSSAAAREAPDDLTTAAVSFGSLSGTKGAAAVDGAPAPPQAKSIGMMALVAAAVLVLLAGAARVSVINTQQAGERRPLVRKTATPGGQQRRASGV